MDGYPFDHKDTQQHLQEQIREAQACHAAQRRMLRQFAQALAWMGKRFMVWSQRLQPQPQTLERQSN